MSAIRTSFAPGQSSSWQTKPSTRCFEPCGRPGCWKRSTGSRKWNGRTRPMAGAPLKAEIKGEAPLAGVIVHGRADRIDRLPDRGLAIIDYKTGKPPSQKAVD